MDPASLRDRPTPWLIGVLHLPALPGAPGHGRPMADLRTEAVADARVLADAGFTAVMVENFHDAPFAPQDVAAETTAALAVVTADVVDAVDIPVGVNVLRNDALAALGICGATGASFLRVNVLAGAAVTDQGLVQGRAYELLRQRARLGLQHVMILADVDVKHATSLDTRAAPVRARELIGRGGADAVLVTGEATGRAVDTDQLRAVAEALAPAPVLVASGTTTGTLPDLLERCAGAVVGTALKNPQSGRVDPVRAAAIARARHP